ncbi:TetR family transcriptional regulator [Gordonia sp. HY002]|uniref:TetR/AcrR family transcriptional regulator n=1 Tax=Gordonia zhenghanii TaxID=2911516 RepID=UPI001EF0A313|nr:TetR family transcriptional regulator [Gordonia zhenghanii]MCF8569213.1 TetR family transcriptional regulator [Gordonia zhenghanii]MCF8603555.1 TetR family transcriptional regulator [Gordonia zhenghanii]
MDRDRMLEVGVGLVSRFGAKALSLTSVARHAGVARATAYRMFGGRDALVDAIVSHELDQLRQHLTTWGADEPDVAGVVRARVVGSLEYIRAHEALQYMLREEPEEIVRAIISTDETRPSLVQRVVDVSIVDVTDAEASALYPNPRAAAEFLVRMVYSCMLVPGSAMSDDEVADLVVRAVVR